MTTRRHRVVSALLPALGLAAGLVVASLPAAAAEEFSQAETLLWMTDQLAAVEQPVRLVYSFEKSGTLEQGFSDRVEFVVDAVNDDGTKAARLNFFTGERNFPVPPVSNTTVNPVLKVYLQGDVYEMNRLTDPDGSSRERWRYFQRRIKFAFAEAAEVKPAQFMFDGRQYQGHEVTIEPYRNDPHKQQFEILSGKRYRFVVSEALPGYLYSIETRVPGDGDQNLIREYLELSAVEPADS